MSTQESPCQSPLEAILMSTHNVCFYGELQKIIVQLSSNTLLIYSPDECALLYPPCKIHTIQFYNNNIQLKALLHQSKSY